MINLETITDGQILRRIAAAWRAFDRYENYRGDSYDEKGTELYRKYQIAVEHAEECRNLAPYLFPVFP